MISTGETRTRWIFLAHSVCLIIIFNIIQQDKHPRQKFKQNLIWYGQPDSHYNRFFSLGILAYFIFWPISCFHELLLSMLYILLFSAKTWLSLPNYDATNKCHYLNNVSQALSAERFNFICRESFQNRRVLIGHKGLFIQAKSVNVMTW